MQILYPVFAMFALTAFVVFRLGLMRLSAIRRKAVDARLYKSFQGYEEPERLRIASRHVLNLFEAPVLFYVVAILIYVADQVSAALVVLSWLYVLARCVHSYIHLTSNRLPRRFQAFVASWIALTLIWIIFAGQLALT